MKDGVIFKLVPRSLPPVTCAVDADTMKAANCEKRGQGQENKIRFSFLVKLLFYSLCCFSFSIAAKPAAFRLEQNYPNPFNPETVIRYTLCNKAHVKLRILNLRGEEITTLIDQPQNSGSYDVNWNGNDRNGNRVSNGIYLYQFKVGRFTAVRKMLFIK